MKKAGRYCMIILIFVITLTNIQNTYAIDNGRPEKIKLNCDGIFTDTKGTISYISKDSNIIMLPIRFIIEALGERIEWLKDSNQVNIKIIKDNTVDNIYLRLDKNTYYYENQDIEKSTKFEIIEGRSYAPVDFFKEVLNISVDYHEKNRMVVINTPNRDKYKLRLGEMKTDNRDHQLWNSTIKSYLEDDLWTDLYSYDAGHFLMIPMHFAFENNEREWQKQFSDHFTRFVDAYNDRDENITEDRLNKLHYLYLASQFIVLCEKSDNGDLIPTGLVDIINNEVSNIWEKEPAWQWGQAPFEGGMKERILWKLETKEVKESYYRAIIDEEFFTISIAADILTYENLNSKAKEIENTYDFKNEIIDCAYKIFLNEGIFYEDGAWVFQPGVWHQHSDYSYAGNAVKSNNINPSIVENIAMDSSHSARFPLWINSFIEVYKTCDNQKKDFFVKIRGGLEKQFFENVIFEPNEDFAGYRTTNFMDGRNGVYRWNYPTQGQGNGYGPYELSGTLTLGWWSFLKSERINEIYCKTANLFPLPEDVLKVYVGPNTSRVRHTLIQEPDRYYNGLTELISRLACKIH